MKIIQLEEERNRVLDFLAGPVPERARLRAIIRFFEIAKRHFTFAVLQSYYLEFSSVFFQSIRRNTLCYSDPEWLSLVLDMVDTVAATLPSSVSADALEECRGVILSALAEEYLVLGEWDHGFEALERASSEATDSDVRDRLRRVLILHDDGQAAWEAVRSSLARTHPRTSRLCGDMVQRWFERFRGHWPDRLNLLFVERGENAPDPSFAEGVIYPVRIKTLLRPGQAEDDTIRLSNNWIGKAGAVLPRLRKRLAAARHLLRSAFPPSVAERQYLFQFSILERDAVYSGNSFEAPMALLAAGSMINAYYGRPIVQFHSDTAVSAGLTPEGGLMPVGGVAAKIRAAFFSPVTRVVVPFQNLQDALAEVEILRVKHPNRRLAIESADILEDLFNDRNLVGKCKVSWWLRLFAGLKRNRVKLAWAGLGISILAIFTIWSGTFLFKDRNPVQFDIAGSILIAKNAAGGELWTHDFGIFLTQNRYIGNPYRAVWNDLNGDGKNELLFGIYENEFQSMSGKVFCLDSKGNILFQVKTGHAMAFGGKTYADHYRVAFITVHDVDRDGRKEILTISHQFPYFPCVVNVWNLKGEKVGEYWHSGQLEHLECIDLDRNGIPEILAVGVNNEYNCAVLAVFAPFTFYGASPQTVGGEYEANNRAKGTEFCYIRFPQSDIYRITHARDVALAVQSVQNGLQISILNNGGVETGSLSPNYYYVLGMDLSLKELSVGDAYRYRMIQLTGREPVADSITRLKRVHYQVGSKWTKPADLSERTEAGRRPFPKPAPSSPILDVVKTTHAPAIDGIMESVWNISPCTFLSKFTDFGSTTRHGWSWTDLSACFRIMWDEANLYLFIQVEDDTASELRNHFWENDGVEVYIDGDHSKQGPYDSRDVHWVHDRNYPVFRTVNGIFRYPSELKSAARNRTNGWDLELAVSLRNLSIPSVLGQVFGFEIQVNDNDDGSRNHEVKWADTHNDADINNALFGSARLIFERFRRVSEITVRGTVTDARLRPFSGIMVSFTDLSGATQIVSDTTNRMGQYSVVIRTQSRSANFDDVNPLDVSGFVLGQNTPNPFDQATLIPFETSNPTRVELDIFETGGKRVKSLVAEEFEAGTHHAVWDARDDAGNAVAPGIYVCRLRTQNGSQFKKILLSGKLDGTELLSSRLALDGSSRALLKTNHGHYRVRLSRDEQQAIVPKEIINIKILRDTVMNFIVAPR